MGEEEGEKRGGGNHNLAELARNKITEFFSLPVNPIQMLIFDLINTMYIYHIK